MTSRTHRSVPTDAPVTRATRGEVARLAGVSTAVVSYVVNGGPRAVAPSTEARVREAMRLLDYRPNASARALRLGSTQTLGLVVSDSTNPHYVEYTSELVKAAASAGKLILIADTVHESRPGSEVIESLVSRQVDGLLLATTLESSMLALPGSQIPTVLIDSSGPVPGRRSVGTAAEAAIEALTRHLLEHGRRRIGLLIGEGAESQGPDPRERGWRSALRAAGLSDGPIVCAPWTREGGFAAGRTLVASDAEFDAVVASSDMQGIGLMRALRQESLRIPDDVAVVAYDGTNESQYTWPPLTVARQPLADLASAAISLLEDSAVPHAGAHREFPASLVFNASCGCSDAPVRIVGSHRLVRAGTASL